MYKMTARAIRHVGNPKQAAFVGPDAGRAANAGAEWA